MNSERNIHVQQINKVLNHLQFHLGNEIQLSELADLGGFSKFHFSRLFKAYTGETVIAFLKRKRLEKAAYYLRFTEKSISEIAYEIGYDVPSSLNVPFAKMFGCTPSEFRKTKQKLQQTKNDIMELKAMQLEVRIEQTQDLEVIFLRTFGYNQASIGRAWRTIMPYVAQKGIYGPNSKVIGAALDDPENVDPSKCEYHASVSSDLPLVPEDDFSVRTLQGGKYAVFTLEGSYDQMEDAYAWILRKWLPESGYQLRDAEVYDHYLNSMVNTPENELLTDIYLPIS